MKKQFLLIYFGLTCGALGTPQADIDARVRELESKVSLLDGIRIQQDKEITICERRIEELELLLLEGKQEKPVWLMGAVKRIGLYRFEKGMKLGNLITKAKGFTDNSARGRVFITRFDANQEKQMITFQFVGSLPSDREIDSSPELLPGDRIFAPEQVR